MASMDLMFRFLGVDAGAGREFDKMARKSDMTRHAIGAFAVGAATAAAGVAVESVKMAASFQSSMELLRTQAGASQGEVERMSKSVLALAGPTATAPEELAKGLYHLESTGLRGAKALNALRVAAEGAKVGQANLEDVTNALNAVIASHIKGSKDLNAAMGMLNTTVGIGDMRMQDLADAMGTGVLAVVKGFGVTLRDTSAALAVFGDNNIRGADAGTQLRMAVLNLAVGTPKAGKVLAAIGTSSKQLRDDLASGGLNKALLDLHKHLVDSGDTGSRMGDVLLQAFGKKAGTGLSILEGQLGRWNSKFKEAVADPKKFTAAWQATQQTFSVKFAQMRAAVEALMITLGTALLPVVTRLVTSLNGFLLPAVQSLGQMFNGQTTPAAGHLSNALRGLSNAFDGLRETFRNHKEMDNFAYAVRSVSTVLLRLAGPVMRAVIGEAAGFIQTVAAIGAAFRALPRVIGSVVGHIVTGMRMIGDAVLNGVGAIVHGVDVVVQHMPFIPSSIKHALRDADSAITSFHSSFDATMTSLANDAYGWGNSIGTDLGSGLISGLNAQIPHATVAGKILVQSTAKQMRLAAQAHSPSRITIALGKDLGEGLAVGMETKTVRTTKAAKALVQTVTDALATLTQNRDSLYGQITGGLMAPSSIGNIFNQTDTLGSQMAPSVGGILDMLGGNRKTLLREKKDLRILRRRHVPESLIQQIASLDPTQGVQVADVLRHASRGQIRQIARDERAIDRTAHQIGKSVADAIYGKAIRLDRRDLNYLASRIKGHGNVTLNRHHLDKRNGHVVLAH